MKLRAPKPKFVPRPVAQVLADLQMMQNPLCDFDQDELVSVLDEVEAHTGVKPKYELEDLYTFLPGIEAALAARLDPTQAQQPLTPELMHKTNQPHATETNDQSGESLVRQYEALTDFAARSAFLAQHGDTLRELIRKEQFEQSKARTN